MFLASFELMLEFWQQNLVNYRNLAIELFDQPRFCVSIPDKPICLNVSVLKSPPSNWHLGIDSGK